MRHYSVLTPLCVSGLGRAYARFHASPSPLYFQRAAMAALKSICSGEACRAFSGIGVSIRCRYAFSPASVVLSPFGAFPSSASRLLCVPAAFDWLLAVAWVPLTSFIFILVYHQCPRCQ